jgi:hypothetical protein
VYRSFLALLAATAVSAAPLGKGPDRPLYYPVTVGAKSVLEYVPAAGAGGTTFESVETVTAVEAKDGRYRVTAEREVKAKNLVTVYEVSADGVRRLASGGKDLAAPVPLIKLPAKAGETWTAAGSTYTVGAEVEVEVPAGKYKAVPVTSEQDRGGETLKATTWMAAGVGVVKRVISANGTDTVYVLKSFTPGK